MENECNSLHDGSMVLFIASQKSNFSYTFTVADRVHNNNVIGIHIENLTKKNIMLLIKFMSMTNLSMKPWAPF